jgi:hypothetical protein
VGADDIMQHGSGGSFAADADASAAPRVASSLPENPSGGDTMQPLAANPKRKGPWHRRTTR